MTQQQTALVVEGGAMRGIFSCGVLDGFLQQHFMPFDFCIGVSAGANNLAAYLCEDYKRNLKVYTDYSLRPEFIRWGRWLAGGDLFDLDWMWSVTQEEIPLSLTRLTPSKPKFYCVMTNVDTGQAQYLETNADTVYGHLKASSALPLAYRKTIEYQGMKLCDGGVADSIPVIRAYEMGARRIMVIRSRPFHFQMQTSSMAWLLKRLLAQQPSLYEAMLQRHLHYQKALDFMRNPPEDLEVVEVFPPDQYAVSRTTKDEQVLRAAYQQGVDEAGRAVARWTTTGFVESEPESSHSLMFE